LRPIKFAWHYGCYDQNAGISATQIETGAPPGRHISSPAAYHFWTSAAQRRGTVATVNSFEAGPLAQLLSVASTLTFVIFGSSLGLTKVPSRHALLEIFADPPLMRCPAPGDTLNLANVRFSDIEPHLSAHLAAGAAHVTLHFWPARMGTTA